MTTPGRRRLALLGLLLTALGVTAHHATVDVGEHLASSAAADRLGSAIRVARGLASIPTAELDDVVTALARMLQDDESPRARRAATVALARLGTRAAAAVDALLAVTTEPDRTLAGHAARALHAIAPADARVRTVVRAFAASDDRLLRALAPTPN